MCAYKYWKIILNMSTEMQLSLPLTFRLRCPGQRPHSTKHITHIRTTKAFLKYFKTKIVNFSFVFLIIRIALLKTNLIYNRDFV